MILIRIHRRYLWLTKRAVVIAAGPEPFSGRNRPPSLKSMV